MRQGAEADPDGLCHGGWPWEASRVMERLASRISALTVREESPGDARVRVEILSGPRPDGRMFVPLWTDGEAETAHRRADAIADAVRPPH